MTASTRALRVCESHAPLLSGRGARLTASANCIPILLNVPVTKVRLTDCTPTFERAPILDSAVFIAPIAKLIDAMVTQSDEGPICMKMMINASQIAIAAKTSRRIRRTEEYASKAPANEPPTKNKMPVPNELLAQYYPCPI